MTRTHAERQELFRRLGVDLGLTYSGPAGRYDDADLATTATVHGAGTANDVEVVRDVDAARQLLVNRIQTRRGELAPLGHPAYGSRHHELIGEPNVQRTRDLIKLHILECLRHEPRVAKVLGCAVTTHDRRRDLVRVEIDVRLVDRPEPLNLVVPLELGSST